MAKVFGDLVRLLAPILVFTADEAWGHQNPGSSVHLELFPEEKTPDAEILARFEVLQDLRNEVAQVLEKAQRDGIVGKALEASVLVSTEETALLAAAMEAGAEIEEFLILSNLTIIQGERGISVTKTESEKCERCWRHRPEVGSHAEHPTLCGRCVDAVGASGIGLS
jgi:isoleucyl-tRNA synthetase